MQSVAYCEVACIDVESGMWRKKSNRRVSPHPRTDIQQAECDAAEDTD
jgi:hypothetical protein